MNEILIENSGFKVEVLSKTDRPNLLCYLAMHQDYSENYVWKEYDKISALSEEELGDRLVRNCIKYNHWGPIEHASITFNAINYPHNVIVQARTHRIATSFDCMSQRYTSKRILRLGEDLKHWEENEEYYDDCIPLDKKELIEQVFYFRPVGYYDDRDGNKYYYSEKERDKDISFIEDVVFYYCDKVKNKGFAPEHARDTLAQNIRQHFVVTFNPRSLLHFCDMRTPKDAQMEIRDLAYRLFNHFEQWMPEVAKLYKEKRLGKNLLSP